MATYITVPVPIPGFGGALIETLRLRRVIMDDESGVTAIVGMGKMVEEPDPDWAPGPEETEDDRPLITVFRAAEKTPESTECIAGAEFVAFGAWCAAQEGKEVTSEYGTLYDRRSVMRWIGWREMHKILVPLGLWEQYWPGLVSVMGTQPPSFG